MTEPKITSENSSNDTIPAITLDIKSKASIIHIGSLDSFDITEGGKEAAKLILEYLENGNEKLLRKAIEIYDEIIPNENFGGEYTALQWICRLFIAPKKDKEYLLSHPMVESWFDLLARDDYKNLKGYLKKKYHFEEIGKDDPEGRVMLRFLEDFILFNNPDRERWDKIGENVYHLGLHEGNRVIDFGCGPGYFTFKFADIVGKTGHVYGIETNDRHIIYDNDYINKYNIKNVNVYQYQPDGWGLADDVKADAIFMCSLYHILYAALTDGERDLFIASIKKHLIEGGRLIIVDNDLVESTDLPYHGPYISRDLIISQLWHYGFELVSQYQFTVQRYILEFKLATTPHKLTASASAPITMPAMFVGDSANLIKVTSPASLVRYRMIGTSSKGYTIMGKKAARQFYLALETKDRTLLENTIQEYEELIPQERIGDEYTAFVWVCKYLLASEDEQKSMIADNFDAEYFNYISADDFKVLKTYIKIMYDLEKQDPEMPKLSNPDSDFAKKWIHDVVYEYSGNEMSFDKLNDLNELISFNNPARERWEKTSEMLKYINIKEGESVADMGCGFGFFTYKFSQLVGKTGKVYSTEINKEALEYVENLNKKYNLGVTTVKAELNDICLPEASVDTIFMCSMYHAVYIGSIEFVKDQLIASLKKALRKGGRIVIVDNSITPPGVVPYVGSGIAKELTISQLKHYGFHLVDSKEFIPQRYVLVFQQD